MTNRAMHWRSIRGRAEQHEGEEEFAKAGNEYTLAAYGAASAGEITVAPIEENQIENADALRLFLKAILNYRKAGARSRSVNRARQGSLIATDLRDHVVNYSAQKGLMEEIIGDYKLISGQDYRPNYDSARDIYRDIDNDIGWQSEPEFEFNVDFLFEVCDESGFEIPEPKREKIKIASLNERINFKIEKYEEIINSIA